MCLHNSLPFDNAGYAIRSHNILRALQQIGVSASAYTRPGYPTDLSQHVGISAQPADVIDGITYRRMCAGDTSLGDIESEYVNAYANALVAEIDASDAGIVHAASNYLDGLAAVVAARRSAIKSVYEVRGLWHMSRASKEPGYKDTEHYRYSERSEFEAARRADAVVTISEALKRLLIHGGIQLKRYVLSQMR